MINQGTGPFESLVFYFKVVEQSLVGCERQPFTGVSFLKTRFSIKLKFGTYKVNLKDVTFTLRFMDKIKEHKNFQSSKFTLHAPLIRFPSE